MRYQKIAITVSSLLLMTACSSPTGSAGSAEDFPSETVKIIGDAVTRLMDHCAHQQTDLLHERQVRLPALGQPHDDGHRQADGRGVHDVGGGIDGHRLVGEDQDDGPAAGHDAQRLERGVEQQGGAARPG